MGFRGIFPLHALQHGVALHKLRDLGQVADIQASPPHHGAAVRLHQPGHNLEQRGLSGAVYADQPHLLPLVQGKRRVVKEQTLRI